MRPSKQMVMGGQPYWVLKTQHRPVVDGAALLGQPTEAWSSHHRSRDQQLPSPG
jgi:hypothetical protein